ncbi:hypothetical protein HYV89_04210 [Candidatus Woesearchaeota archaeon]|nr:hypothetical protein [Candidatus Woesearchaeota archaeon]
MKLKINGRLYSVKKVGLLGSILGLMFSRKRNLLFHLDNKKRIIHSFFVLYSIELYFLDEKFNVVEKSVLAPFWFYMPKHKAKYLVEIPL